MDPITENAVDDFANAFAELNEPQPAAPKADEAIITEAPAVAPVVAEPAAEIPAVAEPAAEIPAVVPAVAEPVAEPVVAQAAVDRIAALEAEILGLRKPPAVEVKPEPVVPIHTAEESALIEEYKKAWPDIQAGEALIRRAEYRDLVKYVFDQVQQHIDPAVSFYHKQQGRTQYSDLVELVPDYDIVRDKTLSWIDTQPSYLKKAYQDVANTGSAEDVADLINRFKRETNYSAAATAAVPVTPVAAPAVPRAIPAAAVAAVAALRVVRSGRTDPTTPVDVNDFDSAFAEFSKAR